MREPSQRKEQEVTTSEKEEKVEVGESVLEEKRVREAELAAAKWCGDIGEKSMEGMEEMRFEIWWDLKEDQYLDSEVFDRAFDLGFSFGLVGKVLEMVISWGCSTRRSAIEVFFYSLSRVYQRFIVLRNLQLVITPLNFQYLKCHKYYYIITLNCPCPSPSPSPRSSSRP